MLQRLSTAPSPTKTLRFSSHHPLLSLLNSCKTLDQIKQAHAKMIAAGLFLHPFPPSKLLELLLSPSPPLLPYADLVFRHSPSPPLFSYNTLIKAHSSPASLLLFRSLLRDPSAPLPNQYTFAFVLAACGPEGFGLVEGEQVRGQLIRRGFEANVFVSNVVIRMYGSWGLLDDARKVFDESSERDLVSWNSLIGGYAGAGDVDRAKELFDEMPERDVVSWSTVIAGYVQVGCFVEAMELFREMQLAGATPNEFTLTTVLAACANLVALDQGRWIHIYINKARIKMNDRLLAGLIDMYAKCGEVESAWKLFNDQTNTKRTVRPWNAMLSGFAIHGRSDEAVKLFERMKKINVLPDKVTFVSLLNACSHGRLVHQGRLYLSSMKSVHGIDPEIEHYGCMVDLLGRAGLLKEAEEMISTMPMAPDTVIWGALLGACCIHGDIEMGKRIGKLISEVEPKHVGCHVLLANIYSGSRRWNDARDVRKHLEIANGRKTPGCSSIELNGMFYQFLVGDRSHPQTKQIYSFLDEMAIKLKIAGYTPEVGEVLLDIDEEDRETALSRHSEKLAIAFGLMNTSSGTPIRIVKNLRVCRDCHHATKFISKVYDREIIVRDRIRFHHFKDGYCSCKDYW
ncbi:pentatricopeptide repeat-containing protein At3g62890-like [Phoenix dactylifera]|uniref:Pentatricopeptide repeat-containing protein At3g62890-like n=1 Tax=Phoenix dactylifera TaxID=42345 RepID=A0A8B7CEN2_PHODC|nr:pentatricopeptide repeat-containing protein At3g62890-like [Phoenix dactylifera]